MGWKSLEHSNVTPVFDGATEDQVKEQIRKAKDMLVEHRSRNLKEEE
jgi:hypothetical protein